MNVATAAAEQLHFRSEPGTVACPVPVAPVARRRILRSVSAPADGGLESFPSVLLAAQTGAEWALTVLYRRHNPRVLRFLRARAGAEGDDLASQTWIDVARNLSRFDGDEDAFAGWVFTIARRRLIDSHRRRVRRREEHVDDRLLAEIRAVDDPAAATVEGLAGDEAARRIVDLLPERQAEIVLLRVLGGLSVAEVAEITGQRPGTVRVTQHRALRQLAHAIAEERNAHDPRDDGPHDA